MRRAALLVALAAIVLLTLVSKPAVGGEILVATSGQTFAAGMSMPTDVAVGPGGEIYVADGVNDRVIVFGADGNVRKTLRRGAGRSLRNPTAVATSADGRLWIADAGRRRVVVVQPGGREYTVPLGPAWRARVDMTDLVVSPDGNTLWIVDNDRHRLHRGDLLSGAWTSVGSEGSALGQLYFPFMMGRGANGDVFVSDVLNARIQHFDGAGAPARAIGRFGVTPGQMHRPSGVAAVGGNVWVADATLGVIQVFTEGAHLVDVVRAKGGGPLRLDHPLGIDVLGDKLYVVEMGADRVRQFVIERAAGKPRVSIRARTGSKEISGAECTICHLEAVPDLVERNAAALIKPVRDSTEDPWVSRDESCLSCHDGAVMDSRRKVWKGYSHKLGTLEGMASIKTELPLPGGEVACRTCHTAHTLGGSGQQHRDALMLRVEGQPSDLCTDCHFDSHDDGQHPVGAVGETGGGVDPSIERIDCLDCHMNHGGRDSALLSNAAEHEACETCHIGVERHASGEHPLQVEKDAAKAARKLGGHIGWDNVVVCRSCHEMHTASPPEARCETCHPSQVVKGADDAPRHSEVPCIQCHLAHEGAGVDRRGYMTDADPKGCLYCHGDGAEHQPVEAHPGSIGHVMVDAEKTTDPPLEGCPSCHGAHDSTPKDQTLCRECHLEQDEEVAKTGHGDATCLDCHPAHEPTPHMDDDERADLNPVSRRCLGCHSEAVEVEGMEDAPRVAEYEHPTPVFADDGKRMLALEGMQLFDPTGKVLPTDQNGALTCATCHRTHGPDREHPGTKRRRPGTPPACASCHAEEALPYYLYFHRPERRERYVDDKEKKKKKKR